MGLFENFPYTNFHEINLDQIIKIMRQMQDEWQQVENDWDSMQDFINNYFDNLDVSEEVLQALQTMAGDGELNTIIDPVIVAETASWLAEHITPTSPAVDNTLSVAGAAADAKATGDAVADLKEDLYRVWSVADGASYSVIDNKFVNGRGYSYSVIGYSELNSFTSRSDRASAFIIDASIGSIISFDPMICAINYYIVGYNDYHTYYYTPDVWDASGKIVTKIDTTQKYKSKLSMVLVVKKTDGSTISSEDLVTISNCITVKNNNNVTPLETVDVLLFAGQSNIAGRGITNASHTEQAPNVPYGTALEYKAITDPTALYPLRNNFGVNENKTGYIDDGNMKTGSLVPSFANSYYPISDNHIPIVCVSASQGGTSISDWVNNKIIDAVQRFTDCVTYLNSIGVNIRHKYVIWCQGETDGDNGTSKANYLAGFNSVMSAFKSAGIEKCLLIRIGNCNVSGAYTRYSDMIEWQTEIAQTDNFVVMISCDFAGMRERNMMKDEFHYYQDGYNECGMYAGVNAGIYALTGKEQTMYDSEYDNLYYSHKN